MSFVGDLQNLVVGDSNKAEAPRPSTAVPLVCNWLPYRSHGAKRKLFFNARSRGFVIEAAPMVGASERTGETIAHFLPEGVSAAPRSKAPPSLRPTASGASRPKSLTTSSAPSPRPAAVAAGTPLPKNATEAAMGAIKSANESAALSAAASTVETTARQSARTAPVPTLRAGSFPGFSGDDR